MLRIIGGVIVGYLVMALLIFVFFTCAWFALGADGAFAPGTFDVSMMWILVTFALGFVAALIGGFVAAWIGGAGRTPTILAGVVLVLGLLLAIPAAMGAKPDPGPREGAVSMFEGAGKANQPAWIAFLNPILGAVGILAGAQLKKP